MSATWDELGRFALFARVRAVSLCLVYAPFPGRSDVLRMRNANSHGYQSSHASSTFDLVRRVNPVPSLFT